MPNFAAEIHEKSLPIFFYTFLEIVTKYDHLSENISNENFLDVITNIGEITKTYSSEALSFALFNRGLLSTSTISKLRSLIGKKNLMIEIIEILQRSENDSPSPNKILLSSPFSYLLYALNIVLDKKNFEVAERLLALAVALINQCDATALNKKLQQKNVPQDTKFNAFYLLAVMLGVSRKHSNNTISNPTLLTNTLSLTDIIVNKCDAITLTEGIFSRVNAGGVTKDSSNGLIALTIFLHHAAANVKNYDDCRASISLVSKIFDKYCFDQFSDGFMHVTSLDVYPGANALFFLMESLAFMIEKHEHIAGIILLYNLIHNLVEKLAPLPLINGLSQKIANGEKSSYAGTSGCYWLMRAIALSANKNNNSLPLVLCIVEHIIQKCNATTPLLITLATNCLSHARMSDACAGKGGFYTLMSALFNTAYTESNDFTRLLALAAQLFSQSSDDNEIASGLLLMSQSSSGFYWLMKTLHFIAYKTEIVEIKGRYSQAKKLLTPLLSSHRHRNDILVENLNRSASKEKEKTSLITLFREIAINHVCNECDEEVRALIVGNMV